jgi:hypothetical protein
MAIVHTDGLVRVNTARGLQPVGNTPGMVVRTHTVVIRNTGRLSAHNVRVPHNLPLAPPLNFTIVPQTAFTCAPLSGGGEEIVFPVLVPGQQVTISYLYFPPLLYLQINLPVRSDEGMARVINVLPTPQRPKWFRAALWTLAFVGAVTLLYLVYEVFFLFRTRFFP